MSAGIIAPRSEDRVITVGDVQAQITGFSSTSIQLAIDAARERGGGVIKLDSGIFKIISPIRLYDNITLIGSGESTILYKVDGVKTNFIVDADYGELKVTVQDASNLKVGMGVQLMDAETAKGWDVSTAVITSIENNTIYLDNYLIRDYKSDREGIVSNACSIVEGIGIQNAKISNLVIDGNKDKNDQINGCRGGAIYFHKSKNCFVENVKVVDFNGDGISWQITENISIRNCEITRCTNYGLHPGTGSFQTGIEECECHDNGSDGLFICWRVQNSVIQNNSIHHNGRSGISIGHKDTDNIFERNHIYQNALCGIYIRPESECNGAHRNTYIHNVIENNGNNETGYGIYINGETKDNRIENNSIRDTGERRQKTGIFIDTGASNIQVSNNQMSGHLADDLVDLSSD